MSPISASRENGLPTDKIEAYLSSLTSLLELFRTLVSQSGMNLLSIIDPHAIAWHQMRMKTLRVYPFSFSLFLFFNFTP